MGANKKGDENTLCRIISWYVLDIYTACYYNYNLLVYI